MASARSRQLAYFKDNIQSQEDQDDFDASRYYYNRDDQLVTAPTGSSSGVVSSPTLSSGAGGIYTHPSRSFPVPNMTAQNPISFAPSSDLLAMLSRGVSLRTAEPVQTIPDNSDLSFHPLPPEEHGMHATAQPSMDSRRAPFDMSEFPALAGQVSLPHCIGRESLSDEVPGFRMPCVDTETTFARDHSKLETLTSIDTQQFSSNEDLAGPRQLQTLSFEYSREEGSSNFAIQSEDFPALPGTQMAPALLGSENDIVPCAPSEVMHFEPSTKLPRAVNVEEGYSDNSAMRALSAVGSSDLELPTSKNPMLQMNEHVVPAAPELANSSLDPSNTISHKAFDRLSQPPRNKGAFGRSSRLNAPAVGLVAQVGTKSKEGKSDSENQTKYGLLGLLDVIRMTNADLNTLALGSDLTTLGLNLNSSECLYSTFASPWAEAPTTREPQFALPLCYYMQPPPLKTSHLSKFQLETLFYIFYAMPKDVLQAYSAQEL